MTNKEPLQITTLYHRLYVTFFEAHADILKATNRNAFYRLSIYDEDSMIAEMVEGINPVILADKIFLNSAVINFHNLVTKPLLKVKLKSHYGMNDVTIGEAELNLQRINDNYFQFTQRFNSLQLVIFSSQIGQLKLIFNIFVQKNKVDLDLYIKKFKENQREVMKAKRYIASKKKLEAQEKAADIQNKQSVRQVSNKGTNSIKNLSQQRQRERSRSRSANRKKMVEVVSNSSNYLQINSAAKFKDSRLEKATPPPKKIMNQIQQKEFQAYSSKMQSFHNSKILSYDMGTTSIISDGSQQSQMINNNLTQTYSERAVTRFRQNFLRCLNITLLIIVLSLLYILLAPTTKIQKKAKGKSQIKMSKIAQELIDI